MKIVVIGSGYVGLVGGVCFAHLGHEVTCVDIEQEKIDGLQQGIIPIYEPGLDNLLESSRSNIHFSTQLTAIEHQTDIIMIAVGTPTTPEQDADMRYVMQAVKDLAPFLKAENKTILVTKSTVPVQTGQQIKDLLLTLRPDLKYSLDYAVASNPEFLREGSAVYDFLHPDRIVIGTDCLLATDKLAQLYEPLRIQGKKLMVTSIQSAELAKYASNGFLALKIAFINQMADLCEKVDGHVLDVARIMGEDHRISPSFLNPGPGYGGSCFPKDTQALAKIAQKNDVSLSLIDSVIQSNHERKRRLAQRIIAYSHSHQQIRKIAILGTTFKANTDDLRESAALSFVPALINASIQVRIYDPIYHADNMKSFKIAEFEGASWAKTIEEVLENVDGCCILTEWDVFTNIDWQLYKHKMARKTPLLADFRNLFHHRIPEGFDYMGLGMKDVIRSSFDE